MFDGIVSAFASLWERIDFVFIQDDRWLYLRDGLLVTLQVAFFAVLLGIVIGFLVAIVRSAYDRNKATSLPAVGIKKLWRGLFACANWFCKLYLTVIRGTPVTVQLLIIYFVIFTWPDASKVVAAVTAFGINSGAYVAEIVRSGIMSIDAGQMEAGRSLGFNFVQTMWYIVIPQALKNVLPALGNEFIVLLKETSVSGFIALQDLTKGGDIIRGRTFEALLPLFAVALIYLAVVSLMSAAVNAFERRLRASDH